MDQPTAGQALRALEGAEPVAVGAWRPRANPERQRDGDLAELYGRVAPAVVVVLTGEAHGTGFLVDPAGWVVTNQHVIAGAGVDPDSGSQVATVYLGGIGPDGVMRLDERGRPAFVYKASESKDLALLIGDKAPHLTTDEYLDAVDAELKKRMG